MRKGDEEVILPIFGLGSVCEGSGGVLACFRRRGLRYLVTNFEQKK